MTASRPEAVVIAKGNCGIPQVLGDQIVYTGTPSLMADYARLALDAGAKILGGCCGTTPGHVRAMRQALEGYAKGERPDLDKITTVIGPLTAPPPTATRDESARRSRRRSAQ
jgi:5-methyltetrahydrofolate--homocysteine methyltransferase